MLHYYKNDAIYVDENGEIIDRAEIIFQIKNNNGDIYTISRADSGILNRDNSIITLDKIITNFKQTIAFTEDYIKSSFQDIIDEYSTPEGLSSLILIINDGLNKNLSIKEMLKKFKRMLMMKFENVLMENVP